MKAELFHDEGRTDRRIDRRTDMRKLVAAFRNFANEPKNCKGNLHTLGPINILVITEEGTYQKYYSMLYFLNFCNSHNIIHLPKLN